MAVFRDFFRALAQFSDPPTRGIIWRSLALTAGCFAVLVCACIGALHSIDLLGVEWGWLETMLDLLGDVLAVWLAWLLLPGVVAATASMFLDKVVERTEACYFPHLAPAAPQPLTAQISNSLRLLGATLLINLLALPLYFYLPVLNIGIWLVVNGYLIGRDYFVMVAQRRMPPRDAERLRVGAGLPVLLAGMVVAGLMAVPLVNLVAPVLGVAFFTHRVLRYPPAQGASRPTP